MIYWILEEHLFRRTPTGTYLIKVNNRDTRTKCEIYSKLKVVSATFSLVCFLCLKESICETRKNVFYFTSKALFVLEIIKFEPFRYSNVMTSSNA